MGKQLKVWDQYLDWQIMQGDHQRTVILFERCLIPCALYEQFWAKYARYLERAHKEGIDVEEIEDVGGNDENGHEDVNNSFALKGWRESLEETNNQPQKSDRNMDTKESNEEGAKDEGYEEETITDKPENTADEKEMVVEDSEKVVEVNVENGK